VSSVRIELDNAKLAKAALQDSRPAGRTIAEAIAERARGATDDRIVVNEGGQKRWRFYIVRLDGGATAEAQDRNLGRAAASGGE
jgi:hypothetical protein